MRQTEAIRHYGVELTNPLLISSTVSENPRQVILSLWKHSFNEDMTRYETKTAGWKGAGKVILPRDPRQAMNEGRPLRVLLESTDDPHEIVAGNATQTENHFNPNSSWRVGL